MKTNDFECPEGRSHAWEAGMMVVHEEDLKAVAAVREVVCAVCEHVYQGDLAPLN